MKLTKKAKIISILIIFFVVIITIGLLIKNNMYNQPQNVIKIIPENVDLQIKDFNYTEVGDANSKVEVKADIAKYIKQENLAVLDGVNIKLTTSEGKVFIMTGNKGQIDTKKKDIEMKGNVVITTDKGEKLTTDYLNYSEAEKKVYTKAPVTMESNKMIVKGTGLTININTGELSIASLVKAKIN